MGPAGTGQQHGTMRIRRGQVAPRADADRAKCDAAGGLATTADTFDFHMVRIALRGESDTVADHFDTVVHLVDGAVMELSSQP